MKLRPRTKDMPYLGVEQAAGFFLGAAALCCFATVQKLALAVSLTPQGYTVPFLFGGVTGFVLGLIYKRLHATNSELIQARHHLEHEVQKRTQHLEETLAQVKTLEGLIPICAHCKSIRDEKGAWNRLEAYFEKKTDIQFSHSICKDCIDRHYPEYKAEA